MWFRNPLVRALIPYVLLLGTVLTAKGCYDRGQREQGRLREQLRIADSTVKTLEQRKARVDVRYRTDTVRLAANTRLWRSAIATLGADVDRLRDSVTRLGQVPPDTVPVPVEVIRWVAQAGDSVVTACTAAVTTCEQRVAVRDSIASALRREIALVQKQRPSTARRWTGRLLLGALGALGAFFASR